MQAPWNCHERNADPIIVEDIALLREPPQLIATVLAEGIHALAFIPVAGDAELSGKFMVYCDTPRVFTEHERDIALQHPFGPLVGT
ncbi:hypothetical protein [Bosea vaviloviae]|uniref:GAF domain-containing protein n=1 Tax=Bosea vaviloviae TaxID=1526658 RepID=A0A1D7U624_9HYPH|nr:hypothetical protein [Bosea vaviloviae]AOO82807.1 hypothetical protein BHK69_22345 [Bosea vaviloviae]